MTFYLAIYETVGSNCPDLKDLVIHVTPAIADKWNVLGLVLLDSKYADHLKTIEANHHDVQTRCLKMFDKWLNTDTMASWDKMIEALEKIQMNIAARRIRQLLLQGEFM